MIYQTENQGHKLFTAPFQEVKPLRSEVYIFVWVFATVFFILPFAQQQAAQVLCCVLLCSQPTLCICNISISPSVVGVTLLKFSKLCIAVSFLKSMKRQQQLSHLPETNAQMHTKWQTHQQPPTDSKPPGQQSSPEARHLGHSLLLLGSHANSARSPHSGRLLPEGWVQDNQLLFYWKYSAGWARPILKKFIIWIVQFPENFPLTVQEEWGNGSVTHTHTHTHTHTL